VDFTCADNPDVNRLTIGLLAVINEDERERISERTKAALAAAKARGQTLGNPNGAAAIRRAAKGNGASVTSIKANADSFAEGLRETVGAIKTAGATSLAAIAAELNNRHMRTPRGGKWHASSVKNLLDRLQVS
jgi:DNA invertase Pin-like site-specific DNA recombinase